MVARSASHTAPRSSGGAREAVLQLEDAGGPAHEQHVYWLGALECLIERAQAFSQSGAPVRWGWCRTIKSFLFVFEAANRIVVEKPSWSNSTRYATYLFEMESPTPVDEQARRRTPCRCAACCCGCL